MSDSLWVVLFLSAPTVGVLVAMKLLFLQKENKRLKGENAFIAGSSILFMLSFYLESVLSGRTALSDLRVLLREIEPQSGPENSFAYNMFCEVKSLIDLADQGFMTQFELRQKIENFARENLPKQIIERSRVDLEEAV